MRTHAEARTCPQCSATLQGAGERCLECQQLLVPPPPLPLLRRPGANWALVAIMLGLLGTISWGILGALAIPALAMAWRNSNHHRAHTACPGVRLLVCVGLIATALGIGVGLWSLSTLGRVPPATSVAAPAAGR